VSNTHHCHFIITYAESLRDDDHFTVSSIVGVLVNLWHSSKVVQHVHLLYLLFTQSYISQSLLGLSILRKFNIRRKFLETFATPLDWYGSMRMCI